MIGTQYNWLNPDFSRIGARLRPMEASDLTILRAVSGEIITNAETDLIAAQGPGLKIYVTDILVTCGHATQGSYVQLMDGAAGTVLWKGYAAPAGGGFQCNLKTPIPCSANTKLVGKALTTGSEIIISVSGYQGT